MFFIQLREEDQGEYKCVASNFKGSDTKCVQVKLPPPKIEKDPIFDDLETENSDNTDTYGLKDDGYLEIDKNKEKIDTKYENYFDDNYLDSECQMEHFDCFCERKYEKLWVDCREQEITNFENIRGKKS